MVAMIAAMVVCLLQEKMQIKEVAADIVIVDVTAKIVSQRVVIVERMVIDVKGVVIANVTVTTVAHRGKILRTRKEGEGVGEGEEGVGDQAVIQTVIQILT